MKKIIPLTAIAIALIFGLAGFTQKPNGPYTGIYASWNDFKQGKLTYRIDCNYSSEKLKLNDVFGSKTGYVNYQGQKYAFDKTQVFGYRLCDNTIYRFYQGESYRILDTCGFLMYYKYGSIEVNKGKGLVKEDQYFFSKRGEGPIIPLTRENLAIAFSNNTALRYTLESDFQSDKDLVAYDQFQKMYKIKYLYNQSLK